MRKYEQLASDIIEKIGGESNIQSLTHCITRLRFTLLEESIVKEKELTELDGVVTIMHGANQFQVVIGNHVAEVYDEVRKLANIESDVQKEEDPKGNIFTKLINIISSIFTPIISALSAAGVIKGVNALLIALEVYGYDDGAYIVFNAIGDAIFMYLPVVIGYSAAKKFGLKPLLGMIIGLALCYPAIQASTLSGTLEPLYMLFEGTVLESPVYLEFFGLPLIAIDYTSSVLPVILIVFLGAKVEKLSKKWVPEVIQFFLVPVFTLLVSLVFGFFAIGPIATFLANGIGELILSIHNISPVISGIVIGFFWQILVIFGVHWGTTPIYVNNVMTLGFDSVTMPFFGASFAQTAVIVAIYLKTKNKKRKEMCIPAAISGFCGITEPAIYGISLPLRTPFIISCIAAAIAGGFYGLFELKEYVWGGIGVFEFPSFINPETGSFGNMYVGIIGAIIAFVVGFILTIVFYKEKEEPTIVTAMKTSDMKTKEVITSPITGEVKKLSEITDKAFAGGALGKGIAIVPTKGEVVAPFDGTVMTLFPTKHAIGIISDTGIELLIHIGLNTVELRGEHFTSHIKQGAKIKKGDLLVTFDIQTIKEKGYELETPIVVTNYSEYLEIVEPTKTRVLAGEEILTLL